MKKFISVICVIILLLGTAAAATGCIFNTGAIDEVKGIYGLDEYWYRDINKTTHNFGDKYDYYIVVLYGTEAEGDNTYNGKVYCKPTDGTETSYDITYTVSYDTDKPTKVSNIKINNLRWLYFGLDTSGNVSSTEATVGTAVDFSFRPQREDIVANNSTIVKNSAGTLVSVKTRLQYNKIYSNTSDARVEKAKTKQTNNRTNRSTSTDDE